MQPSHPPSAWTCSSTRLVELVGAERQLMRDEKLPGRPRGDAQLEKGGGLLRRAPHSSLDETVFEAIDPAGLAGRHEERRRHAELPPRLAVTNEHALATRAGHVELIAHHRQQAHKVRIAEIRLRRKDPGAVAGDAEVLAVDPAGLAGLRRMCPCGRQTAASLLRPTTCVAAPWKNARRAPSESRSSWRRSPGHHASQSAAVGTSPWSQSEWVKTEVGPAAVGGRLRGRIHAEATSLVSRSASLAVEAAG